MKKLLIILILFLLPGCGQIPLSGGTAISENLKLKAPIDKILTHAETDWIVKKPHGVLENKGRIITYDYITDIQPTEKVIFQQGEIYSQMFQVSDNTFQIWGGNRPHYYKDAIGKVFKIEQNATTTIEAFAEQTKVSFFKKLIARATDYPPSGDDGERYVVYNAAADWATAHDALTGTGVSDTAGTVIDVHTEIYLSKFYINKGATPFDNSGLADDAYISSASISVYKESTGDGDNDGEDYIVAVQSTQANPNSLVVADYDQFGTTEWSNEIDIGSISAGYNTFTLVNIGTNYDQISRTGYTQVGWLEGHDHLNHAIATGANFLSFYNSRYTGTDHDPYMTITLGSPALPVVKKGEIIWFD
ncbi:MAG: hypothetical protein WC619_01860 [Patescibacteria group bacterium]